MTDDLAAIRARIAELEVIRETTGDPLAGGVAEAELKRLLDAVENVRELRPRRPRHH